MSEGYLYCFSNESMPGILKIGMTERTPELRLNEANGSDTWKPPTPYKIEFAKKVLNPKQQETMLHKLLEQYTERVNPKREFFRISVEKARKFFDLIDDYIEEDDFEEEFEDINDEELTIEDGDSFTTGEQTNLKMEEKYCRFFCKKCNYQTCQKSHFDKHLLTSKHSRINKFIIDNSISKDNRNCRYACDCGEKYKFRQELFLHKKNCQHKHHDLSNQNISNSDMFFQFIKENEEVMELLKEQSKENSEIRKKLLKIIKTNY
jgi:hypothetical protein